MKRPLNTCFDCDYTWYPRGHYISKHCPHCGSKNVGIQYIQIIPLLLIVGLLLFILI
jgi:Zn finger protein HypA/HybF involved in hydrogenase expression